MIMGKGKVKLRHIQQLSNSGMIIYDVLAIDVLNFTFVCIS